MRARRGDVDDSAPAGLDHVGQHRLNAVKDAVEVDVDDPLPVVERDVGEPLELLESGGVDQNRDRPQLSADGGQCVVDCSAVGDVGGVGEFGIGRIEVDDRDVQAVGAQPLGDRLSNAGAASGHDRGLHAQASAIKNRPSDYENRTLGNCDPARQQWNRIPTGETFAGRLSHR